MFCIALTYRSMSLGGSKIDNCAQLVLLLLVIR